MCIHCAGSASRYLLKRDRHMAQTSQTHYACTTLAATRVFWAKYDIALLYMVSRECACPRRPGAAASVSLRLARLPPLQAKCGCARASRACFGHKRTTLAAKHVCALQHQAAPIGFEATTPCVQTCGPAMNLPVVSSVDETASLSTGWRTVVTVIVGTCSDMIVTAQ